MGMQKLDDLDDLVKDIFVAKNHDELLFFTSLGRVYSMRVYEVAEGSRTSKGRAIVNLLPLVEGEYVVKLLCMRGMENKNVVMVSKKGIIKKTDAQAFAKIRVSGIRAVGLREDDALAFCGVSSGTDDIVLATAHGQGIRFKEEEVRVMGRQAAGVIGIRMREDDYVVGMEIIDDEEKNLLFATQQGYGKRTRVGDFRVAHRGGQGVRTIPTDRRNGDVVGLVIVAEASHILLIDDIGKIIHLLPKEVRTMGRQAKGVRLIRLDNGRRLASIVAFEEEGSDVEGEEGGPTEPITDVQVETSSNDETTDAPETVKPARKAKLKADGSEDDSDFMSFEGAEQDDYSYEAPQRDVSPVADLLEDEGMVYFDKSSDDDDNQTMLF